jgi:N-methylhydantoinase B
MNATDPLLREVIRHGFDTVADEMALVLMKAAYSAIIRDSMDYSTALCDVAGQIIGQGLTTPMHLGSFYDAMVHLIRQYEGDIADGDIFIGNDPYLASGQHLPDIYIIKPIFYDGRLEGWATTIAHHADVGGLVPGSNSIGATEIFQEGLRLPFLKLRAGGSDNQTVWAIIAANLRVPDLVLGDIRAQIAACTAGERGFKDMLRRFKPGVLHGAVAELHDMAERMAKLAIREIPDGSYSFTDHIDGLGEHPESIVLTVRITVAGDEIETDWTGTSPQVAGGINAPLSFLKSNVYAALRSIMLTDIPNCHGYTRPIHVVAPPGTLVNALPPAPCGARGITGYRIVDCMFGALAQALPDAVPADGNGGSTLPSFGGWRDGNPFVFSECVMGTWGATSAHDGQEGVPHMASNQSNVPVEMIEADYPLRIERYGFVPDTGGPGRFRGGLSLVREYRVLADGTFLGVRSDKRYHPPHGLLGGGAGSASTNLVNPGPDERTLPPLPILPVTLRAGDLFRHVMAGGGGFGPAFERDPERVREDVMDGKVTLTHAHAAYGVVLGPAPHFVIDAEATHRLRRGAASGG